MSGCIHCSEPLEGKEPGRTSCCWARAMEIKKFKNLVFHKYITEVIFDVIVSVASVITDIISLILYIKKGHLLLALITAIPVLLPTIVFTNIYMADETKGYCKLPAKRPPSRISDIKGSNSSSTSDSEETKSCEGTTNPNSRLGKLHSKIDFHWPSLHFFCSSCQGCWGGILRSVFTSDQDIRKRGMNLTRKSIKRLSKYFFGTFVLRFIALAWYFKALNFGIKAFKEPKKYMKIERPNSHWSYDLLVRLDFLQAALENAPQCIVQLYVLLTYPDENTTVGILTLLFSFVDFIRVSASVEWDLRRGPVIAPSGCYDTLFWKLLNVCSWIFLYIGRSAALALVIATAEGWSISIPVVILVTHLLLFGKLFSQRKYGVAAQKVFVSVFISLFFLPEFESTEPLRLIQFYYAVTHVQNVLFIVPWMGFNYTNCIRHWGKQDELSSGLIKIIPKFNQTIGNYSEETEDYLESTVGSLTSRMSDNPEAKCFIDSQYIIMAVPCLTVVGIVMRLASSQRMAEFKESIPKREETMIMEERVARIYSKKWTQMSIKHMTSAFIKMLRKEVIASDDTDKNDNDDSNSQSIYFVSKTLDREFRMSQQFIRQAFSVILAPEKAGKTQRSMSVDANAGSNCIRRRITGQEGNPRLIEGIDEMGGVQRSKSHDDIAIMGFYDTGGTLKEEEEKNEIPTVDGINNEFQLVRIDSSDGEPYYLEMAWI